MASVESLRGDACETWRPILMMLGAIAVESRVGLSGFLRNRTLGADIAASDPMIVFRLGRHYDEEGEKKTAWLGR